LLLMEEEDGYVKIVDMRIGQRAKVKGKIALKGSVREFNKFGRTGQVCECVISDGTGEIKLVLWDEQVEEYNEGDELEAAVHAKEYKGEMQLNLLRENFS
jgi:replication factor A1